MHVAACVFGCDGDKLFKYEGQIRTFMAVRTDRDFVLYGGVF